MSETSLDRINEKMDRFIEMLEKFTKVAKLVPDLVLQGGVALAGANAAKHPIGAVMGLTALKLAQSPGLISSGAGVAGLLAIGVGNLPIDPATMSNEDIVENANRHMCESVGGRWNSESQECIR